MVLLCTNTYNIVTSSFGMGSALASAAVWQPGQVVPTIVRGCGDMEEHCQQASVVVIAEVEPNCYGRGGHFQGAVFDHSLQVAPCCTLQGIMSVLLYTAGGGGFKL